MHGKRNFQVGSMGSCRSGARGEVTWQTGGENHRCELLGDILVELELEMLRAGPLVHGECASGAVG